MANENKVITYPLNKKDILELLKDALDTSKLTHVLTPVEIFDSLINGTDGDYRDATDEEVEWIKNNWDRLYFALGKWHLTKRFSSGFNEDGASIIAGAIDHTNSEFGCIWEIQLQKEDNKWVINIHYAEI